MNSPVMSRGKMPTDLETFQKKLLQLFCVKPEVKAFVKQKLMDEKQKDALSRQAGLLKDRLRDLCVGNKMKNRLAILRSERFSDTYFSGFECVGSSCDRYDRMNKSAHDEKKYGQVVQEVCLEEYPHGEISGSGKSRDMSKIYQQILDTIS